MKISIAVLMSTYNGAKFLEQQIDSIIDQSNKDWDLYIRDDGSSDSTIEIIKDYAQKYKNIHFIEDIFNKGAAQSFMYLLKIISADYYMFCDQDDLWEATKIEKSLNEIELFKNYKMPLLVFCDAKVTDENLKIIDNSFWNYNKAFPNILLDNKEFIKVFNCVPGCTMMFNSELKKYLIDYDSNIIMHDWYILIKALKHGKVSAIYKSLMLYRQHQNNTVGADKISRKIIYNRLFSLKETIIRQIRTFKFVKKYMSTNIFEYYYLKAKFNYLRFKKL